MAQKIAAVLSSQLIVVRCLKDLFNTYRFHIVRFLQILFLLHFSYWYVNTVRLELKDYNNVTNYDIFIIIIICNWQMAN